MNIDPEQQRQAVAAHTLAALRRFREKLQAGIPIEGVAITRIQTPDGPATLRQPIVINTEQESSDAD